MEVFAPPAWGAYILAAGQFVRLSFAIAHEVSSMTFFDGLFSLENQTAVVTGAANGFGRLFAEGLANAGANVVLMDINEDGLQETAELVRQAGRSAITYTVDVSDERQVEDAFSDARTRAESIDILINNAGIGELSRVMMHEYPSDDWHRMIAVNLNNVFYCSRAALKIMFPNKRGKIVNMASIWGLTGGGFVKAGGYAATKGAVVNLTREMAIQYAPHNIQINAICPGFHKTSIMNFDDPSMKQVVDMMKQHTPAGRIADARELLGTLIYLASPASNFMSGSLIVADGGFLAQ